MSQPSYNRVTVMTHEPSNKWKDEYKNGEGEGTEKQTHMCTGRQI